MKWQPITISEQEYNLDHLHPFEYNLTVPAQGHKPERKYRLNVIFSLHCFTRGQKDEEVIPAEYKYSDTRETRIFDIERYNLSIKLPDIVRSLSDMKCYHDRHNNFYVVELIDELGHITYYSIFFKLSKAGKKKGLNLFVSSAYARDEMPYAKNLKPIRFRIMVHNVHTGQKTRPAR
ncbi:MAG: hypothetical protein COB54_00665 [Alphaproteobacteria bacterium]|nr:MAG: hypothetical protein COB54_00665 [Alphaproteobacteria bacterium]